MSEPVDPLENFAGRVRLFPLPNLVLFPQVMQPLHIFEPRYRQMTADALAGDRLITMILLRPGWEEDYTGQPPLYSVGCVGKIVAEQKLPDGRFNILLRGLGRIRIEREIPTTKLYRQAQGELLAEGAVADPDQASRLRQALHDAVPHWFGEQKEVLNQVNTLFQSELPLGTLADILAFTSPLDVEVKQRLLEELDVEQRVYRLLEHQAGPVAAAPQKTGDRKFPPEFSEN